MADTVVGFVLGYLFHETTVGQPFLPTEEKAAELEPVELSPEAQEILDELQDWVRSGCPDG